MSAYQARELATLKLIDENIAAIDWFSVLHPADNKNVYGTLEPEIKWPQTPYRVVLVLLMCGLMCGVGWTFFC